MPHNKQVTFVTFGMFIIDEIEWHTPNPPSPKYNLLGGAGSYAVLGARIASSPSQELSRSISWIVDVGSDFPDQVRKDIEHWKTDCNFRVNKDRLTTRAWNGYGQGELRAFKYLTPKIRLEVSSLSDQQICSKSFHMVCSPQRSLDLTTRLAEKRFGLAPTLEKPVVVWEPIPDLCSPEELERLHEAASRCTVVSPNSDEMTMFFSEELVQQESQVQLAARLMGWKDESASLPVLIVREGAKGSTAYLSTGQSIHVNAYHNSSMASAVIDPTGGGNTYLGAIAIAMTDALDGQSPYKEICHSLSISKLNYDYSPNATQLLVQKLTVAMVYASIAASYAIEQNGAPILKRQEVSNEIWEDWNDQQFIERLGCFLKREADAIHSQLVS